ncbi:hypothetical protein DCO49_00420 [Stenotrophomonas sp. SPM]|uniref:AAA family ATPase n=1 Tax=Stenotrophomonas sp. SPM TaxID=2170735 RepID=UPI000DE6893E|nr:AAA family ATPase [Stenotrophomonas sp. SPM]PWB29865.1 hypothetical protein DCO49_00420 [Stenotrophomonas sp. SPM]
MTAGRKKRSTRALGAFQTVFTRKGEPIIETSSMEDALNRIVVAIEKGYRGIGFHSQSRFGKTFLSWYICKSLDWCAYTYVAVCAIARSFGYAESMFMNWIITDLGQRPIARQSAQNRLDRVINAIEMMLKNADTDRLLLVVDDAHLLETAALQHFATLDNELEKRGKSIFVVFLFQDRHTSNKQEEINKLYAPPQIRGRFFTQFHQFHGIRSRSDLKDFLQQFEDDAEMRPGAGETLPRSLAPHLYDGPFRIAEFSDKLWDCGVQQRVAAGRGEFDEWPLQAVSVMARYIARQIITKPGFTEMTDDDIRLAIGYSDLVEYDSACAELKFTPDRGNAADPEGVQEDEDV